MNLLIMTKRIERAYICRHKTALESGKEHTLHVFETDVVGATQTCMLPSNIYRYICIIYNMILRSIWKKYKPGNKGFCLEISFEGLRPFGDFSSKNPEWPGLHFFHIALKIKSYTIYLTLIFTEAICM